MLDYMDLNHDGNLSDDERDEDGDGLGNWDESHGHMTPQWWMAEYSKDPNKETPYPITFAGTSMLAWDSDGDGLPDGADDQDFDHLTNAFEIYRRKGWETTYISIGPGTGHNWNGTAPTDPDGAGPLTAADARYYSRVQPFNPCKPVYSDRCHVHPDFGYYPETEDWKGAINPPDHGAKSSDLP
jgi:hypothetical protein